MTVDQLGRAYEGYRRTAGSRSVLALLVANAIPLIGVLFFGWSLLTILVIYWLENGIVGLWNVPRIILAQGSAILRLPPLPDAAALAATRDPAAAKQLQADWERARDAQGRAIATATSDVGATPAFVRMFGSARFPTAGRVALAIFFMTHYGVFWVVHGIFVFTISSFGVAAVDCGIGSAAFPDPCAGPFGEVLWPNVAIAAGALFLSHGASFLFNFIGRGEYVTSSATSQMSAPYGRVVVLHLTIIFGAIAAGFLGSPIWALVILVVLKTVFDLKLHQREHRNDGPPRPAGIAGPA